jgi:hypothetical protein
VDLKFFCGFSFEAIAALRGVCKRTVQRDWERARLHLYGMLGYGSSAGQLQDCARRD